MKHHTLGPMDPKAPKQRSDRPARVRALSRRAGRVRVSFPCTQCGACCRWTEALVAAGMSVTKDGACAHLDGNDCTIYDRRPEVCRVKSDDHAATAEICVQLQKAEGLGPEWAPVVT